MKVIDKIDELRQEIKKQKMQKMTHGSAEMATVGFVPTMGFLHEGHASLIRAARKDTDIVVLSIFVNPLQFGPSEDFETYPRDHERDLSLAQSLGVDLVFLPSTEEMYPIASKTKVIVEEITDVLCGRSRPGHFDGVATVVMKLLNIVMPDAAYFGLKDAQQVAVIQQMVSDLNIPVKIIACPIVREDDGLALSSRNVYLSAEERKQALRLSEALFQADAWLKDCQNNTVATCRQLIVRWIEQAPLAKVDYVDILTYPSLKPIDLNQRSSHLSGELLIAVAVKFGNTRLIDNRLIKLKEGNMNV